MFLTIFIIIITVILKTEVMMLKSFAIKEIN